MTARFILRSFFVASLALLTLLTGTSSTSAQATRETERYTRTYVFGSVNPCNGEAVTATGEAQVTIRTVTDAQGVVHFDYSLVLRGVRGVGQSGAVYKLVGVEQANLTPAGDGTWATTSTSTMNFISQGSGLNFQTHSTIRVIHDASGNDTFQIFQDRAECKG